MLRCLVILFLFWCAGVHADEWRGKVVHVTDGDTITVVDENRTRHTIRLATIDAPESGQAYGKASRQHLSSLVMGHQVKVQSSRHDQYGREVGKVLLQHAQCSSCGFTRDVGLAQIEAGYAWWYRDFKHEQTLSDQGYYEYAEFDAKSRRIGLWLDDQPMPPWEWRKTHKFQAKTPASRPGWMTAGFRHKRHHLTHPRGGRAGWQHNLSFQAGS